MRVSAILVGFLVIGVFAAVAPPGVPSEAQQNCYVTGFCITNSNFLSYYNGRGQHNTLGYPVSRSFILQGFEVQIFQRLVLQMNQGSVAQLNLLDPGIMPLTRANASTFPPPDPALAAAAPQVGSPNYAQAVVDFVKSTAPDVYQGRQVNFFNTFNTAVPPQPGANPDTQTLMNLEIWGVTTSNPAFDPNNNQFIYQRFQRNIMHYQQAPNVTAGILVGDYFKSVITGQNLPPDLAVDMQGSIYYLQYDPTKPNWVARPEQLPSTNLTDAFTTGTGAAPAPPAPPPAGPTATTPPGATATVTPTVTGAGAPAITTFSIDDETIDPGQSVQVTIIAADDDGVDWIQFEGVLEDDSDDNGNSNGNDNTASDPAFSQQEFDCDSQKQCAKIFNITPNTAGDYTLKARAQDEKGNRSAWSTTDLRVRSGATPTVTATGAATATATTPPTATVTSTPKP